MEAWLAKHHQLNEGCGTDWNTFALPDGPLQDELSIKPLLGQYAPSLNSRIIFCLCSLCSHLNVLTIPPPLFRGCSEGLDAFRFLFKSHFCLDSSTCATSTSVHRCSQRGGDDLKTPPVYSRSRIKITEFLQKMAGMKAVHTGKNSDPNLY